MPDIFYDDTTGESPVAPWYDLQDGTGEKQPSAVYVDLQDGSGEQLVWQAKQLVDGYEDGSTSPYTGVGANEATVDTTALYEGTYGLHIAHNATPSAGLFYCTPDLTTTPPNSIWLWAGTHFEFYVKPVDANANLIFYFGAAQANSYYKYECRMFGSTDVLELAADNNGSHDILGTTAYTWTSGNWYRVDIWYDESGTGDHSISLYDVSTGTLEASISGVGTYHQAGGTWDGGGNDFKGWAYYSYAHEWYFDSIYKLN